MFETAAPRDLMGISLAELKDKVRFKQARLGDHLCSAFQCTEYQSMNIQRNPLKRGDAQDDAFECMCTRVQLDAFWSHSTRTVADHVRGAKYMIKYFKRLGITNPMPRLGPFPQGYRMGALQADMVIMRLMEPGTG